MRLSLVIAAVSLCLACGQKRPAQPSLETCKTMGLCGDGPLYGVTTLAFVASDGMGHSRGFHLAGADTGACPASGFTDPTTGMPVDNQLANVVPVLEQQIGSALPTLIQNSINDGGLSLIFEIIGDPSTDTTVDIVVHHGKGSPLLGSDELLLANQTLELAPEAPLGMCTGAVVSNGQVTCGPFELLVPIVVFGNTYDIHMLETMLAMTLPTDGSDPQILFGGTMTVSNIQDIATEAGPGAGDLQPIVQMVVPDLADVADPTTDRCTRISGVLSAIARPVFATE